MDCGWRRVLTERNHRRNSFGSVGVIKTGRPRSGDQIVTIQARRPKTHDRTDFPLSVRLRLQSGSHVQASIVPVLQAVTNRYDR